MTVKASGIVAARQRLADLAKGLREAASGAVVERAAQKIGSQITASAKRILSKHVYSGTAHASALALPAGSTVSLDVIGYLKYHAWWPFRSGMPPFVLSNAIKVYKAELEAALAGQKSPLLAADEAAEERAAAARQKAAERQRREEERHAARVAAERQRTEARRARAAERLERLQRRAADRFKRQDEAKQRRADRARDRRIAAQEAKEGR